MPATQLNLAEPFFEVSHVFNEARWPVREKAIVLNLSHQPITVQKQTITNLQSIIVRDINLENIEQAIVIQGFDHYKDEAALYESVRGKWPSAFQVRGEERLRGVEHYMSPKQWIGKTGLTFYHAGSVPLGVGLHRDHPFCAVPGFREVHTQIVGFGKMQQCLERDEDTLYIEENMAPGITHKPMYDKHGNYPWHQYETITPSIFMAVEILPEGAVQPESSADGSQS